MIRQITRDKQRLVVTGRARVGWRTADVVRTIDLAGEIVPVKVGVASQLIVNCRPAISHEMQADG